MNGKQVFCANKTLLTSHCQPQNPYPVVKWIKVDPIISAVLTMVVSLLPSLSVWAKLNNSSSALKDLVVNKTRAWTSSDPQSLCSYLELGSENLKELHQKVREQLGENWKVRTDWMRVDPKQLLSLSLCGEQHAGRPCCKEMAKHYHCSSTKCSRPAIFHPGKVLDLFSRATLELQ
eukprot:scaffold437_cov168-Ochromonas_danica.AAC.3